MRCERVRRAWPLLGTLVEISLSGRNEQALHSCADAAFKRVEAVHALMSFHSIDSDVSRLNNSPVGHDVQVDQGTWEVIRIACDISKASDGLFDISVGGVMMKCGHLPKTCSQRLDGNTTFRDIELLEDNRVRFKRALAIDLGGIAKGYAVDEAVRVLQEMGVVNGCVNAGGDLRVFGPHSVPVEVRDPARPAEIGAVVQLKDRAFATSASYQATSAFDASGVVLDIKNQGRPEECRSASVRAAQCVIADALTKCVLLSGQASAGLLRQYDADGFLLDPTGPKLIDTQAHDDDVSDSADHRPTSTTAVRECLTDSALPGART